MSFTRKDLALAQLQLGGFAMGKSKVVNFLFTPAADIVY